MKQLIATNLVKVYDNRAVVRKVSLHLKRGEVVGMLGPNGAGKTTTFYMIAGIVKPNGGHVEYAGHDLTDMPLHDRARLGLTYLPQESSVFKKLSVRDNLLVILEHTGLTPFEQSERADRLLEDLRIEHLARQKAMHLSGGERRRLEIARALILNPKFMLLDEPFAGIDPIAVDDIQDIIKGLKRLGIGILISDHNVRETLRICDRAYLVFEGQVIFEGTPAEIVADPKARRHYLGEGFSL
jgi:lipopolysaccharide export system ATP-binding protein